MCRAALAFFKYLPPILTNSLRKITSFYVYLFILIFTVRSRMSNTDESNLIVSIGDDLHINMIYCPPGKFLMGSDDAAPPGSNHQPQHEVTLTKGFWISETPVTRRIHTAVMGEKQGYGNYEETEDSPVSQHTWDEAIDFCTALNTKRSQFLSEIADTDNIQSCLFTLPTEAQWEYACRAGTNTTWYFGEEKDRLDEYAWYHLSPSTKLPKLKLKKPNPWGIYDLYGMVYEWCLDDLTLYSRITSVVDPVYHSSSPLTLPSGAFYTVKVVRGGELSERAEYCTSLSRVSLASYNSENDLTGIRLVLNRS
jgi:formylglycine-generating enzyme required for sulfatase activity